MARQRENAAEPRWDDATERWILQVQIDGKRRAVTSRKEGRAGIQECKRKFTRLLVSPNNSDPRLRDVARDYLNDVAQRKGLESKTYENAELAVRTRFIPSYGSQKVSKITEQDWQRLLQFKITQRRI